MTKILLICMCMIPSQINTVIIQQHPTNHVEDVQQLPHEKLYQELVSRNIPYPTVFTRVAICESGWALDSYLAVICNNLFGFKCINSDISGCGCVEAPDGKYQVFCDKDALLDTLEAWIAKEPPTQGENPYSYLKRRRYNTINPDYYEYLRTKILFEP